MRRTIVRRTAVVASGLSLALLVSACGSDKPAADSAAPKDKGSAAAEPAAKALSQAELDKLVLAQSDLKNHKVAGATKADLAAVKTMTTDKAECKPLVQAMSLSAVGTPAATSTRKIVAVPKAPARDASADEKAAAGMKALSATVTADTLGSYDGKGAPDAFASLSAAGKACAGGFTLVVGSDKTKFTKVAPATYSGGDEAVAFVLTADLDGESGTSHLVAVRKGSTLASFYAQSLGGKAEQPKDVIDTQLAKLG
ncbi:hypothetical protein OG204_32785 [Streptomyces sp. NBC_01387]|uniref:hypothetical protein n=1 Tax=unclassified Streptomyces TaxID=2593676 RepID=UPI002023C4FE|nr:MULTISPECIES: hypothetical protein [unclassified Streptomyces]MCX4553643.1 hypothetical protein [Streptomyces sp. NBC_01500]WSV52632.1 hypothetical protein OG282_02445 [Streptomyces sp. NBC_01014]